MTQATSDTGMHGSIAPPVPVVITNSAPPIKPPYVRKTTVKTWIIDPTGVAGAKYVQIADYEPARLRISINVIDVPVTLTLDSPVTSPDASTASSAPQGLYLPISVAAPNYEFFGPDAMWLNALTAVTRVTVVKEYG